MAIAFLAGAGETFAVFGPATYQATVEAGLRVDIKAPIPEARSMSEAIEHYIRENA